MDDWLGDEGYGFYGIVTKYIPFFENFVSNFMFFKNFQNE
jgi:hypothetical protein